MKAFVIAVVFAVGLLLLFIVGLISSSTLPSISAFCLWSPAMIGIGWTARGIGKRLVLVDVEETSIAAPAASPETRHNNALRRIKAIDPAKQPLL